MLIKIKMKASCLKIKFLFVLFVILTLNESSFSKAPMNHNFDPVLIEWIENYWDYPCQRLFNFPSETIDSNIVSHRIYNTDSLYVSTCVYIRFLDEISNESGKAIIYYAGMNTNHIGLPIILVYYKNNNDDIDFELLWDDPTNISSIRRIWKFFGENEEFSDEVQALCYAIAISTYDQAVSMYRVK